MLPSDNQPRPRRRRLFMQVALHALLDCLHEAERRAEDDETQPALLLLFDLLLQLHVSLEDLAAVPVGVVAKFDCKKGFGFKDARYVCF